MINTTKKYLQDRKIPVIHYDKFYLVDKFYELVKKVKKDIVIKNDHPSLLFLFMIQLVSYLHFKAVPLVKNYQNMLQ